MVRRPDSHGCNSWPGGGSAARNDVLASFHLGPEGVVLLVAGCWGEYGLSIY